jgi:hypothetical protein
MKRVAFDGKRGKHSSEARFLANARLQGEAIEALDRFCRSPNTDRLLTAR